MSLFLMTMWPGASRFSDLHGQTPVRQDTLSNTRSIVVNARKIAIGDNRTPSAVPLLRTQPYPSGYVDSLLIRCFTHMDSVIFSPQQKFWQRDGISGNDGQDDALYGFSVPLVGDLNGDGKPEIVALSIDGSGVNNDSPWLYIINGQTGAVLNKYTLPAKVEHCVDGFHGSPCQLALIDADRNGLGEIIVCFNSTSTTSSSNYGKQIASFEIVDKTKFTLSQKWKTSVRYDAWGKNNSGIADGDASRNYDYPIPHIVDINGDGTPELIVYNKIYNAKTGAYIMKLEDLGKNPSETTTKTAYIGSFCLVPWTGERNGKSHNDTYYESSVAFPSIYDIDGDGKYDYIAGGKIYYDIDVTSTPGSYKILNHTEIPDGRTAVADIDGDGKAEIVVQTCNVISQHDIKNFTLKVWKPDFQNNTGKTVATVTFRADNAHGDWGYSSYLYIGDIDGKEQNGKKLPEISMICGRPFNASESTPNMTNIPVHPNVQKANGGDGLITQNMSLSKNNVEGCLISFTWDLNGTGINDRLKVSFMLEHEDRSVNTGFSLFDFDNDGTNEICYRDEQTLRILSAKKSFVMLDETDPNVIRMKTPCLSYTAYEYPSIADVDNDGSADMIVIGRSRGGAGNTKGYILVVGGANSDLAPAPAVWNQFHYHPMKINKNLQTPPVTFHPLDPDYCFYINDADANPTYTYNSNIMQAVISASFKADNGKEVIRSIVYTPDAKIINARITVSGGQGKLTFMVTNTGNASLDNHTPISIYWDNGTTTTSLNPSPATVDKTIYPGDTVAYTYTVPQASDIYHIIVGDGLLNNGELKPGVMRECNWADNYLQAAIFLPREDLAVVPRYGTVLIDVLANDIL
ncbi:MAG: VCBS repeat-containing protein, partial [Tannerella sp.]|nr:VCBS repeat-containing protein [Tannerella sp.]